MGEANRRNARRRHNAVMEQPRKQLPKLPWRDVKTVSYSSIVGGGATLIGWDDAVVCIVHVINAPNGAGEMLQHHVNQAMLEYTARNQGMRDV